MVYSATNGDKNITMCVVGLWVWKQAQRIPRDPPGGGFPHQGSSDQTWVRG